MDQDVNIKQGTYSYNDGTIIGGATTNSALAATVTNPASITETGLSGSDDNYGPSYSSSNSIC